MTNYEDTNDAVHHLRFLAELAEVRDEEAAFQSFEEHFKASAEDPYFEYELKLWLTAWRKALAYFTEQVAPVRRTSTTNNNADPVGSLVDQWREAAEFFTSGAGFDIRETLIDCADDLEAALAQQRAVHLASTHCDNCGCDWLDNGLNPIGCPYCKQPTAGNWIEYEYEVGQDGVLQAGGIAADYASARSEANHYAMMYAQDGPVEVHIYEKRLLPTAQAKPKLRRYNASGSLSEYGVFPECDAQVPVAATLDDAAADPALTLDVARELMRDAAAGIRQLAAKLAWAQGDAGAVDAKTWLLDVMGTWDFTIPTEAFDEIVNRIAARATPRTEAAEGREAVAYRWEERSYSGGWDTKYGATAPTFENQERWVRNVTPLYTTPPAGGAAPELLAALKKVAQALDWYAHGCCRGFDDGPILTTSEAVELAKRTIAAAEVCHDARC